MMIVDERKYYVHDIYIYIYIYNYIYMIYIYIYNYIYMIYIYIYIYVYIKPFTPANDTSIRDIDKNSEYPTRWTKIRVKMD